MGRYNDARPWFERAVGEAAKGDVHRRPDHDSLGRSVEGVAECFIRGDSYDEARPLFELAVEEKRKGNVFGRVDNESLASSLRAGADCLRKLGLTEKAEEWEREAAELDGR